MATFRNGLFGALVACSIITISAPLGAANITKQVEKLNRGVTAIYNGSGVFVSWRSLGTDAADMTYNIYRGSTKLNTSPLMTTNFTDTGGATTSTYVVRPITGGIELTGDPASSTWSTPYLTVPIQPPAGGTTPDGVAYAYEANDGSVADVDGDGKYEIILKWSPTNAKDNSQGGYTGNTYVDAYRLDGTRLWRIDLGKNIRAGAHYTTFLAYDFDGDGKAEIMMKTADGTVDGKGTVIGSSTADYRNSSGYILSGPEYMTVFNGLTGAAMATTSYVPARGTVGDWGDTYGNRVDRFLGGVAYVDGQRPSAIFSRGYYTRAVVAAWDWRGGVLSNRWTYDSGFTKPASYTTSVYQQGSHWLSTGDANGDGLDDIIYGAATIGSNGKMMYSTGLCHGDALHFGAFDPTRTGQQIFMVHEEPGCYGTSGVEMHDAATGASIWALSGEGADVGRGVCADIDPAYLGEECWGARGGLRTAKGALISTTRPGQMNFAIWWDGDLSRELLDGTTISKWDPATLTTSPLLSASTYGAMSNNSTKSTPVLQADLFGDWREEVILRNSTNTALLIFSTTAPTAYSFPTLMHNPQYRTQVAGQNAAYNQPPHPSYYLGNGMSTPAKVAVYSPLLDATYQAESGTISGTGIVFETTNTGYIGSGYVNFPTAGGTLTWSNVDGGSGGSKTLKIRFALGATTARTGQLVVNGVATNVTFNPTGAWTTWATMDVPTTLNGFMTNTIALKSNGTDLANIDQITVH